MNVADLILRAKALYAIMRDPAKGWYAKFRAFTDFVQYVLPFLPAVSGNLVFADGPPKTADEAMANLEAMAPVPGKVASANEQEVVNNTLVLIQALSPLDCCE